MASEFNRILALLRKERGITQKQAAADLGISQAQLSHYEKGIRECSLAFVVQVADYYGVSCDYLLGRSADRSGQTISVCSYELERPVLSLVSSVVIAVLTSAAGVVFFKRKDLR